MQKFSFKRPSSKKGAPECGIYLRIPDKKITFVFIGMLKKICNCFNNSAYEKNMHIFEYGSKNKKILKDDLCSLREFVQSQGAIFLIRSGHPLAKEIDSDGIILDDLTNIESVKNSLTGEKIIGYNVKKLSKEKAAEAIENNLDLLVISVNKKNNSDEIIEFITWLRSFSGIPCVFEGKTPNDVSDLVNLGVTFIDATFALDKNKIPEEEVSLLLKNIEEASDFKIIN